jgi:glycosyltransferase involved in cell wall biosynthesis
MLNGQVVKAIIPALDEAESIGKVLEALPDWIDETIVVDNGSADQTAAIAASHGARVVSEPVRGYGRACQSGVRASAPTDVCLFLDGDFSDHPEEAGELVGPITEGNYDFVIGSRLRGNLTPGALTAAQRFGNALACGLLRLLWNARYTDLGPFRAIRASTLESLGMRDLGYGWTIEMQIKAARRGCRILEVPVSYRPRIGHSKISGTLKGVLGAGAKILLTIARYAVVR